MNTADKIVVGLLGAAVIGIGGYMLITRNRTQVAVSAGAAGNPAPNWSTSLPNTSPAHPQTGSNPGDPIGQLVGAVTQAANAAAPIIQGIASLLSPSKALQA